MKLIKIEFEVIYKTNNRTEIQKPWEQPPHDHVSVHRVNELNEMI